MNPELSKNIETLIETAPATLDLTDGQHLAQAEESADRICRLAATREEIEALELALLDDTRKIPILVHLAAKLARSKRILSALRGEHHLSIVFAVYQEHQRILSRREHPQGENFLIRKIRQLQWLLGEFPGITWDMTVVDDGCPDRSGEIASRILDEQYDGGNVAVLHLADAIDQGHPVTRPMTSTDQSRKGGSIEYGLWHAARQERPNHIILFTDADLSTHLGQTGLLVDGIVNGQGDSAIGSRREPTSVVIKQGTRNVRGKLFIYLWKRIITSLNYIVDTQCGFKAFTADTVRAIIDDLLEKQFAFDIELLLKTELRRPRSIIKTPVAWIDSEALSTTTDIQPYLSMLRSMVAMYRTYLPATAAADAFADFIESLDEESWNRLVDNVPAPIAGGEPGTFSEFDGVSVEDLRRALSDADGSRSAVP